MCKYECCTFWPHKWFSGNAYHISNTLGVLDSNENGSFQTIIMYYAYFMLGNTFFSKLFNDILFVLNAIKLKKRGLYTFFQEVRLLFFFTYVYACVWKGWRVRVNFFTLISFWTFLETARNEQNKRSDRARPETIECDQHRHDKVTSAAVHKSGYTENGSDSHQQRRHRGIYGDRILKKKESS